MKVLFDHQIFESQYYGGVSRYFSELISNFSDFIEPIISIKYSNNFYIKEKKLTHVDPIINHRSEFIKGFEFKGKGRFFNFVKSIRPSRYLDFYSLNKQYSIECLKKQEFDVFHPTYYDDYFLEYIGNKPYVLTIHDMAHELYPEFYNSKETIDFVKTKAKLAFLAHHIIAVSENTKKDIIEILGIPENKITVAYHGTPSSDIPIKKIETEHPERYVLYVGERTAEYKNFKFFVRAFASFLKEDPNLSLVCVGKPFEREEKYLFDSFGIFNQMQTKIVNDINLKILYQNAICMVYPSYCEGFGIPILEAFQNECPVLLTNISCLPEVGDEAALYFNPKGITSFKKQFGLILHDFELRKKLIEKGLKRAQFFTWSKSVQKTLSVYKSVTSTQKIL